MITAEQFKYKHSTKNIRGFQKTCERRPWQPGTNKKTLGPHWMCHHHTLDRLNWLRFIRRDYTAAHGYGPGRYRPELFV